MCSGTGSCSTFCGTSPSDDCELFTATTASTIFPVLAGDLTTVDHIYPRIRIDLLLVKGRVPEPIEKLSNRLGVPKNYMFISTPGDQLPHKLADLGGVRLVI